jgi:hypothetical protein
MVELDIGNAQNVEAEYNSLTGVATFRIDTRKNYGRTRGGTGPNLTIAGVPGYRKLEGLRGFKICLHLIKAIE